MNPREKRLLGEYNNIKEIASRSDGVIEYEVIGGKIKGLAPDEYIITYNINSIVGINEDESPKYGKKHRLKITFPSSWPMSDIPSFTMITDVWHPNISYHGTQAKGHVCTTKHERSSTSTLEDYIIFIGRMLQWKNYHAIDTPPYPEDGKVAKWVREYAEPKGIVNLKKAIFTDNQDLQQPTQEWLDYIKSLENTEIILPSKPIKKRIIVRKSDSFNSAKSRNISKRIIIKR